jgi:acetyl-CoA carboxylase beta subunit
MSEQLKAKLAELIRELDQAEDPALTERIKPLIAGVEAQLAAEGEVDAAEPGNLVALIDELVTEFEVEYPTLSSMIADISIKLSSMGI